MSRKIRAVDPHEYAMLEDTKHFLRKALDRAKRGKAVRTADKIRSALKSIDGAIRHADGVRIREQYGRYAVPGTLSRNVCHVCRKLWVDCGGKCQID